MIHSFYHKELFTISIKGLENTRKKINEQKKLVKKMFFLEFKFHDFLINQKDEINN